jgi:site-specific recombinase XerD
MYRNTITSENTEESHKEVITSQIPDQLSQISSNENVEAIKDHFKWVLANDFYKDELSAEQITEMESYLPSDYQDEYEDLPE